MINKTISKKEIKWIKLLNEFDKTIDNLGRTIDKQIKDTVIVLNLLGFRTMGSCEGHLSNNRLRFPYIYCEIKGEPKYEYRGERSVRRKLIKKYNIKNWNVVYSNDEIWNDYKKQVIEGLEKSEEWKKWEKKNEPLGEKIKKLINEYNKVKISSKNNKIQVERVYPGYRIVTLMVENEENYSNKEKKKLIKLSQKEFKSFTEFLKDKYFNSK